MFKQLAPQGLSPLQGPELGESFFENMTKPATFFPSYDPKIFLVNPSHICHFWVRLKISCDTKYQI